MPQTVTKTYIAQTRFIFHCHCKIKIPFFYGEHLLDDCFSILEEIDFKYNSYQKGSYFDLINQNAGNWTEVDETTINLLQNIKKIATLTQGSYAISVMPLIKLWGFYQKELAKIPQENEISSILKLVNDQKIEINGNCVKIEKEQELITGSFIKAFAVDEVVKFLKEKNISDAIINAGGSTIMALNNTDHLNWTVNITDPFVKNQLSRKKTISNQCFSLSGRLNNQIEINRKKIGHILNARTGFPSETAQVGVLTECAFLGDILSTALFAVEPQQLSPTINSLQQEFKFEYYRIEANGDKQQSKCF